MENCIEQLNQQQMLQVLANEIGFRFEIPDILTFIDDDYFLGGTYFDKTTGRSRIYPMWRDRLQDLFPNNITTKSSYVTVSGCIGCLTGDTEIETLNGTKTFKELKDIWDKQKEPIYVISANTQKQQIEIDKVIDVFITGKRQVYRITLDNGLSFKCTSNHQFLSKENEWISIDKGLKIGSSLLPFNHAFDNGYYNYINPYSEKEEIRYKIVLEQFIGKKPHGYHSHHIDFCKMNDNPENLVYLTANQHFNIHRGQKEERFFSEKDYLNWYSKKQKERVLQLHYNPKYEKIRKQREEKLSKYMKNGQAKIMSKKRAQKILNDSLLKNKLSQQCINFNKNLHPNLRKDVNKESIMQAVANTGSYRIGVLAEYLNCSKSKIVKEINQSVFDFCSSLGFFYRGKFGTKKHKPTITEILTLYKRYGNESLSFFAEAFNTTEEEIKNEIKQNENLWNTRNYNHKVIKIETLGIEEVYDLTTQNNHNFALTCGIFAHNSGKSTFSSIILMYDYLKLLAMADPGSFFELINLTGIWLYGCSIYSYKADQFIEPIHDILANCPFIKDLKKKGQFNDNIKISPAYGKKSIVSTDAAVIWLSEVNEYKNPNDVISSALARMRGRFQKGMGIFTHFILDCSDTTIDSATETFIHNSPYSSEVVSYKADIWTVKPHLYWHMEPKGFQVYAGDSIVSPHIIADKEDTSTYDEDRLLYVPSELRSDYEIDINKALQETAGVSLISGGMFFPDESIKQYFCLPQKIKDTEIVDFFDSTRILDLDNMLEMIESLPKQRYLFVGLDAGYATDHYGIAIGYADTVINREADKENEGTKDFYVKIPIIFGLSRKQGQETNISKVRDFLYKINEVRPIKMVAYDNFQTVQLAQEMEMIGIKAKYISVEQDKYYILFKHGLTEGKIQLANNELLYREFRCLKHIGDHIDHSNIESINNTAQQVGINSKDIADATVRCYSAIREHLDLAVDIPIENTAYHNEFLGNILTGLTKQREMEKFSSIQDIYKQKQSSMNKAALLKRMW